jgi:hypothetical protein
MIEGHAFLAFHVGMSGGLIHETLLSPIHSVTVLAHEDGVYLVRDHNRECVLKSPISSMGR